MTDAGTVMGEHMFLGLRTASQAPADSGGFSKGKSPNVGPGCSGDVPGGHTSGGDAVDLASCL